MIPKSAVIRQRATAESELKPKANQAFSLSSDEDETTFKEPTSANVEALRFEASTSKDVRKLRFGKAFKLKQAFKLMKTNILI